MDFLKEVLTKYDDLEWCNVGHFKDVSSKKGVIYALRSITKKDLKVPEKHKLKCLVFTYNGAKFFNMLPTQMKKTQIPSKLWQKIGYGKISPHISHHNLFHTFSFKSIAVL